MRDPVPHLQPDALFREILDSAPDGILIVDARGRIIIVNEQIELLFGHPRASLIGEGVELLLPESLRELHTAARQRYQRRPVVRPMGLGLKLTARHRDGSEFPVEISLSPARPELGGLVTAVVRDVSERRRFEEEREQLRVDLETERERYRIAMDLHDGIMQSIYAVGLSLEMAYDDLEGDPREAKRLVARSVDQLHGVIRDIRSYIFDLRPRDYRGNFVSALKALVDEFGENSSIPATLEMHGAPPDVGRDMGMALYHITHEAMSNIRKHAGANAVAVRLSAGDGLLSLEVIDDGIGFDPAAPLAQGHRGLRNMAERARSVGAVLSVESARGAGTRVRVEAALGPARA